MGFDIDLFYPVDSIVHRFDARAKIIFLFSVFIIIFSIKTWISIFIFFIFYGFIIYLSRVPLERLFNGIRTWLFMVVFMCIFPFFATKGRSFIHIGWINITFEGIKEAGILFSKLFLATLGAKILAVTTTIKEITLVFQYFSKPFEIFGFFSDELGFIIIMGIGFIRFFTKEAQQIIQITKLRGIDCEMQRVLKRPSKLFFLIQVIIARMYIIGFQIEESLRLYGYNQHGVKTSFYELKWKLIDWIPIVFVIILGIVVYLV